MSNIKKKNFSQPTIIVLIATTAILIIILFMFVEGRGIFNHSTDKRLEDLITEKYPPETFNEIGYLLNDKSAKVSIDDIRKKVKIECLRKLDEKYYAILVQNDNKKVILYFDKNYTFTNMIRIDKILSKNDFSFVKIGVTTIKDVLNVDKNEFGSPFSGITATWHILSDGYMIISYKTDNNKIVVKNINFYNDNDMKNPKINGVIKDIPQLLKIDKKSLSH